jgi:arginine/lysine/ornithine decarboxylase
MPGHKGGLGAPPAGIELLGRAAYAADLSEVGGFDYLHHPQDALADAQARAARVFHADRSWFLVNGATVGNIAAVSAVVTDGDKILVARASHRSVYAALAISGANPVYLPPLRHDPLDGLFGISTSALERALEEDPAIRAVHLTSPNYYGFTIDLEEIAAIVHGRGIPLIVDEAHGTHFVFHPDLPKSALASGADIVVQSPHKTLGSLTQSSLLHAQGDRVSLARLDAMLQMFQSSSPSALLLVSLDVAITEMAEHGRAHLDKTIDLADSIRARLSRAQPGAYAYGDEVLGQAIVAYDPTKIVIDVARLGLSGLGAARLLKEKWRINPEFSDMRRMVFLLTSADTEQSADLLVEAITSLGASAEGTVARALVSRWPQHIPTLSVTPREGISREGHAYSMREALGRVSAEMIIPYPPGIPLIVAGEVVDEAVLAAVDQLRADGCRIVGPADASGATLRCID